MGDDACHRGVVVLPVAALAEVLPHEVGRRSDARYGNLKSGEVPNGAYGTGVPHVTDSSSIDLDEPMAC